MSILQVRKLEHRVDEQDTQGHKVTELRLLLITVPYHLFLYLG